MTEIQDQERAILVQTNTSGPVFTASHLVIKIFTY